jgi:hypothetical protein
MTNESLRPTSEKDELNKRIENVGWGFFLIMIGGLWLVPDRFIPEGTWLIGVALIFFGINIVRHLNHIPMSNFSLILGVIAFVIGISDFFKVDLPFFPLLLIIIGLKLLIQPIFERKDQ